MLRVFLQAVASTARLLRAEHIPHAFLRAEYTM